MIAKMRVYGKQRLDGTIHISGAKNSALPLLAASLLSADGLCLKNIPPLTDVTTMLLLLENLGIENQTTKDSIHSCTINLKTDAVSNFVASYDIVRKMRASILVLGPLLARYGRCAISLPGGCAIGVRPIDLHLKGMEALGAEITLKDGYVHATAPRGLTGSVFEFPVVTVTGTENVMMAATLARGETILKNAAKEPEIIDLAKCLNNMGAKISGHGTDTIVIDGVMNLKNTEYSVMADRIEAGTYAIAAGITNGCVNIIGDDLRSILHCFIDKMTEAGLIFSDIENGLRVQSSGMINPINIETAAYPGFPTDLQAQTMSLLCLTEGISNIHENIWENRFMHVAELARMGVDISVSGSHAVVNGVKKLTGANVMATDLRASFALVLAALVADGDTIIDRVYHLDRGYCCVNEKLSGCGVVIERMC